jgi:hypothetical protein
MSTITVEQQTAIASKLAGMHLPSGLGNQHSACSLAAINLALSGKLTDDIPDCMSEVIGRWIIVAQDAMPDDVRNSERWKSLLPLAAGTGRGNERERLDIILDWMWGTVLPSVQPIADQQGFGKQWQKMTTERTVEAANAAARAAAAGTAGWGAGAAARATATWREAMAAGAAAEAAAARAVAAEEAAGAAVWSARATAWAARAVAAATGAATAAAEVAEVARAEAWANFDPCALLERLIRIDNNTQGAA